MSYNHYSGCQRSKPMEFNRSEAVETPAHPANAHQYIDPMLDATCCISNYGNDGATSTEMSDLPHSSAENSASSLYSSPHFAHPHTAAFPMGNPVFETLRNREDTTIFEAHSPYRPSATQIPSQSREQIWSDIRSDSYDATALPREEANVQLVNTTHNGMSPDQQPDGNSDVAQVSNWCDKCEKQLANAKSYRSHMDTHNEALRETWPHKCRLCPARFLWPKDLKKHEPVHEPADGRRDFPCNVPGCGKAYTRRDNMLKHMRREHPSPSSSGSTAAAARSVQAYKTRQQAGTKNRFRHVQYNAHGANRKKKSTAN